MVSCVRVVITLPLVIIVSSTGQLLEEFFYFFSTDFDFANCVVSIRHGHSTSITSVLEELKGADYLKTAEGRSSVTIKDDRSNL